MKLKEQWIRIQIKILNGRVRCLKDENKKICAKIDITKKKTKEKEKAINNHRSRSKEAEKFKKKQKENKDKKNNEYKNKINEGLNLFETKYKKIIKKKFFKKLIKKVKGKENIKKGYEKMELLYKQLKKIKTKNKKSRKRE